MHACWHRDIPRQSTRKHWFIGLFIVAVVLIVVATLAPLLRLHTEDVNNRAAAQRDETAILNNWTNALVDDIIDAVRAVRTVDGYIFSSILKDGDAFVKRNAAENSSYVPNANILADPLFQQAYLDHQRGDIAQFPARGQTPYNRSFVNAHYPLFEFVMRPAAAQSSGLVAMLLGPQGVVAGVYSPDENPVIYGMQYFDLLNASDPISAVNPSPAQVKAEKMSVGFTTCTSRALGLQEPTLSWFLLVLKPLYVSDTRPDENATNFWGFTASLLNLTRIVEREQLAERMDAASMDYVLYDTSQTGQYLIVSTSLPLDSIDKKTLHTFIATSSVSVKLYLSTTLHLAARSSKRMAQADGDTCVQVVGAVVGGVLLLFVIAAAVLLCCTRAYDGRPHAPKAAPFALLIIGPTRGDRLWEAAPDVMPDVQRGTDAVLRSAMAIYHAYQIPATHPYTSSYVTRTVDAAVHMAMHVLEELQRRPVDGPLRAKLGERDGRLLLSCAIHWCTGDRDAAHVRPQGKAYVYEGTSVKEGTRLWLYAAPNTVTLSGDAAHPYAAAMRGVAVAPQRTVTLATRIDRPVELFTATDPASKLLAEAAATAHEGQDKTYVEEARESPASHPSSAFTSKNSSFDICRVGGGGDLLPFRPATELPLPLGSAAARRRELQSQPDTPLTSGSAEPPVYDPVTYALQHPDVPVWVDRALREAFEQQAVALEFNYDTVQLILYYFLVGFKLLFRPLAAPERANIFRRLVTVFGVPQQNILDHLAARCTIRYLQQHDDPGSLGVTGSSENHTASAPVASRELTTGADSLDRPSPPRSHPPPSVLVQQQQQLNADEDDNPLGGNSSNLRGMEGVSAHAADSPLQTSS